jgi:hypothetical protein
MVEKSWWCKLYLQDVLSELESKFEIRIAQSTLRNYQNDGLIPSAKRISLGRWKGTVTEYPDDVVPQVYAAYMLQNDKITAKPAMIARARKLIEQVQKKNPEAGDELSDMLLWMVCRLWLYYVVKASWGLETYAEWDHDKQGFYIRIIDQDGKMYMY